jgi:hypothetical protein
MTNLLRKYSKRKHGWRVVFMWDKDKKIVEDTVLVSNGRGVEYAIAVDEDVDEETKLHWLENRVTKTIKELEEKDMIYVARESLMFGVFAKVIQSQTQCFVDFLTKDKKYDFNMYVSHTDKMARMLKEYYAVFGKENVDAISESLEDITFDVFSNFKKAVEDGRLEEFSAYVKGFYAPTEKAKEAPVKKMKKVK